MTHSKHRHPLFAMTTAGVVVLTVGGCAGPGHVSINSALQQSYGDNIDGTQVFVTLSKKSNGWEIGNPSLTISPGTADSVGILLNDLSPQFANYYAYGSSPFLSYVGNKQTFAIGTYRNALAAAEKDSPYIAHRKKIIDAVDALNNASNDWLSVIYRQIPSLTAPPPKVHYKYGRVVDESGLASTAAITSHAPFNFVTTKITKHEDPAKKVKSSMMKIFAAKVFVNPGQPYAPLVAKMRQEYAKETQAVGAAANKGLYSVSCEQVVSSSGPFAIRVKCVPEGKWGSTVVVSIKILNMLALNPVKPFTIGDNNVAIDVSPKGYLLHNYSSPFVTVKHISFYWQGHVTTIIPPSDELPPHSQSVAMQALPSDYGPQLHNVTKERLMHMRIKTGVAIDYAMGSKTLSFYKPVHISGTNLVKLARAQAQ